jgi:hypothetical protein
VQVGFQIQHQNLYFSRSFLHVVALQIAPGNAERNPTASELLLEFLQSPSLIPKVLLAYAQVELHRTAYRTPNTLVWIVE